MTLTPTLAAEYVTRFRACQIRQERLAEIDRVVRFCVQHQARYEAVAAATGVPWFVIAIIHQLEASGRFDRHLHNGDPLTARTVQVPKGRPKTGQPPFTWVESAIDAMRDVRVDQWTLARTLWFFEDYNGWGYRKPSINIPSPYLWSGSHLYFRGKYVADGTYSPTAVSKQIGAAVLLRQMSDTGAIAEVLV